MREVEWEAAIGIGRRVDAETAKIFDLPVFFYARAANGPRTGSSPFSGGAASRLALRGWRHPSSCTDRGPFEPDPTASAIAVGVRDLLIAFNVELSTPDRDTAAAIARRIRAANGGLPHVKARVFELRDRGRAQVSMNLMDFRETSLEAAFQAVEREARSLGVEVGPLGDRGADPGSGSLRRDGREADAGPPVGHSPGADSFCRGLIRRPSAALRNRQDVGMR